MTRKHLSIPLALLLLLTCTLVSAQSGTYFNKKNYIAIGSEIRLVNNGYSSGPESSTPILSLDFGHILWYNTAVSLTTSYQHQKYSDEIIMQGTSDRMRVEYNIPNISLGLSADFYGSFGSAPKGIFVSLGSQVTRYNAQVTSYKDTSTNTVFTEDIDATIFDLPQNALIVYYRVGLGFNKLISKKSILRIESLVESAKTAKDNWLSFDPGLSTKFKIGYVYFLF